MHRNQFYRHSITLYVPVAAAPIPPLELCPLTPLGDFDPLDFLVSSYPHPRHYILDKCLYKFNACYSFKCNLCGRYVW